MFNYSFSWNSWYQNGEKKNEKIWNEGVKDGKWISWFSNGNKMNEKRYENNKMISDIHWYRDGSIQK